MISFDLKRDKALAGLCLYINGDVPGRHTCLEREALKQAIEARGGRLAQRRSPSVDVVVLGTDMTSQPQLSDQESWWVKPLLQAEDLSTFLLQASDKPGPADALFAAVSLYKERQKNASQCTLDLDSMREVRHSFLYMYGGVFDRIREHFPTMRDKRMKLLGMLPTFHLEWQEYPHQGAIELAPAMRTAGYEIGWQWTHKRDDGCYHTILDTPYDSAEAAVFRGEYESDQIFLWDDLAPDQLTLLADDIWEYLFVACQYQVKRGWMKDWAQRRPTYHSTSEDSRDRITGGQ